MGTDRRRCEGQQHRPVRDAEHGVRYDLGGVQVLAPPLKGGLEGEVFGVPVSHLLLAQPPPNGILIQLLMGCNLMLLHIG